MMVKRFVYSFSWVLKLCVTLLMSIVTAIPCTHSYNPDMSNFRQLADFRLFCLVLGHSCESSRSGLIFTSVGGGGGGSV